MRSAGIHIVREDEIPDLLSEYAEAPHMETWDEKITRRMAKDEEAKALFVTAISLGVIFLLTWVLPAAWRMVR